MTDLTDQLCHLDDVPDGGSNGFVVDTADGRCGIIAVRHDDMVVCYVNSCPHIGTPLEIQPGRFLDKSGQHILCSTHGALFRIEDGLCIAGPCVDDNLTPIATDVREQIIFMDRAALPTIWPPRQPVPKIT